eukprot:TRINITY_DN7174_c0_g1_i1.p1 TRINITY_DN7174_c0_g1~~TRINITY_DN7174_c0_g1_i1.p1  ORF type:complete len:324 (+),score=70.11 TRINITY_DN7174_c0_g1_i1:77-1048(+)
MATSLEWIQFTLQVAITAYTSWYLLCLFMRPRNATPLLSYWMPFIGSAIVFGKAPLHYIKKCHREMGDLFTLYIAGKRMTFVFDPKDHATFFNSEPIINFQEAVKPFTKNAAGIDSDSFQAHHRDIHDFVKGALAPRLLDQYVSSLAERFNTIISRFSTHWTERNMLQVSREIVFPSAVSCLFGSAIPDPLKVYQSFFDFDHDFEYGCQLPAIFLPRWKKAREYLLSVLEPNVKRILSSPSEDSSTLFRGIIQSSDEKNAVNYALLMLWASQANTIPAIFWTFTYLTNHISLYKRVISEVRSALGPSQIPSADDIRKMPFMKW